MNQQNSLKETFPKATHQFLSLLSVFVFLFVTNTTLANAQSYQQRQRVIAYKKQLMAKRQRHAQYQNRRRRHKPKGLFDTLFGADPEPRKQVYRRPRSVIPAPAPKKHPQKVQKATVLGAYSKPKKHQKSKNTLDFSRKKKKQKSSRPMCVRLCDGFYWPVDKIGLASAKKKDYKSICQSSCSSPTHVYYAGYDGDTAKTMRDFRGNRYENLKYAFLYRKKIKKGCRCRPEPWSKAAKKMYERRVQQADNLPDNIAGRKKREKRTAKLNTSFSE